MRSKSVELDGKVIYRRPETPLVAIDSADKVAFFQLKSILQGVLARGTGRPHRLHGALTSGARPAPAPTGTTPGSSASPMTSRWRSGSATTMRAASAARSAAAEPARAPRSRSSSRSSRQAGSMSRRRSRSTRRHRETKRRLIATSGRHTGDDRESRKKRWAFVEYLRADQSGKIVQTEVQHVRAAPTEICGQRSAQGSSIPACAAPAALLLPL